MKKLMGFSAIAACMAAIGCTTTKPEHTGGYQADHAPPIVKDRDQPRMSEKPPTASPKMRGEPEARRRVDPDGINSENYKEEARLLENSFRGEKSSAMLPPGRE